MKLVTVGVALACLCSAVILVMSPGASEAATPPPAQNFGNSAMTVLPGNKIQLHFSTSPKQWFILTNSGQTPLPNFSSPYVVHWNPMAGSSASFNNTWGWRQTNTWGWWQTSPAPGNTPKGSTTNIQVRIPTDAAPGTVYAFQLYTCDWSLCSNSPGGTPPGYSQIFMTVASSAWSSVPYTHEFKYLVTMPRLSPQAPVDVTFDSGDTIWVNSESSPYQDALDNNAYQPPSTHRSNSRLSGLTDSANQQNHPFWYCLGQVCGNTSTSSLGERVIFVDGKIWATKGGDNLLHGSEENRSEVLAYDPSTGGFCTYQVPGNNQELYGITATGTGPATEIWIDGAVGPNHTAGIASFIPSANDVCPGTYSLANSDSYTAYQLPAMNRQCNSNQKCNPTLPAMITADPSGNEIWISQPFGSEIDAFNTSTHKVSTSAYPPQNAYFTINQLPQPEVAAPWQVVADSNYVYAIDFGDDNLIRLAKSTGKIDQIPIPATSDQDRGYGLALSGSKLYFTSPGDPTYGFGYVDVGAWESASSNCSPGVDCVPSPPSALVYSGLTHDADPSRSPSYSGVAAASDGQVAIADFFTGVIRLVPTH